MAVGDHRILLFDRTGILLEEVDGIIDREWLLNKTDQAKFVISSTDAKLTDKNFTTGNRILVLSDDVRPWAGVLWLPITDGASDYKISAFGGKMYFSRRVVAKSPPLDIGAGAMVNWLVNHANTQGITPISISNAGDIESGIGAKIDEGIVSPGMTITRAIDAVAEAVFSEWWLEPIYSNYEVRWELHFKVRREKQGRDLVAGDGNGAVSVKDKSPLVLSGDLLTSFFANINTQGGTIPIVTQNDLAIAKYGFWRGSTTFEFLSWGQIEALSTSWLRRHALPHKRYKMTVNPIKDQSLCRSLEPGGIHNIIIPDVGFTGGVRGIRERARLIAMGYNESVGEVDLVLETTISAEFDDWIGNLRFVK